MKRMILAVTAAVLAAAGPAFADEWGGFAANADSGSLKPFARDLGGVLGSATFHTGRSLGISGWDLGVQGGAQLQPDKNDRILRDHGVSTFGFPWAQASVGLPFNIDAFVRGISFQGLTVAGGGLRWNPSLFKATDKPWTPQVMLVGSAHSAVAQDFHATHFGGNIVVSIGSQVWTPYFGGGVDSTALFVHNSRRDPTQNGRKVTATDSRFTAGLQLKPWQFVYIHGAFVVVHGKSGVEGGLGLRF